MPPRDMVNRPGLGDPRDVVADKRDGRELSPECPQSLASHRVEAFGRGLSLKCTNDIVCVPDQTGLPSTWLRDHPFEPPIHGIGPGHMGKDW